MDTLDITLKGHELFQIAGFSVTNALLSAWVVVVFLVLFAFFMRSKLRMIPGRLQAFLEIGVDALLDYMEGVLESRKLARRFLPLIATLFVFILLANYTELIPGMGSIYYNHDGESTKLFHPASADLNFTLGLAIVSFIVTEAVGFATIGAFRYAGKFFNFKSVTGFLVGIIELVSEFIRLISFSFRLFGNMFAGEVLILVASFFLAFLLPVPILLFEAFIGLVQAAIFAILTLYFIKLAMAEPHGDEDHSESGEQKTTHEAQNASYISNT